jgi:hypothetical protein
MYLALIAAVSALAAAPSDEAPASIQRENSILFQPSLGSIPGLGGIAVSYTRAFSESWAVTTAVDAEVSYSEMLGAPSSVITDMGAGFNVGLTRYLVSRAPTGPWVQMRVGANYRQFSVSSTVLGADPNLGHGYLLRGAMLFGFTAVLEPGFTIQLAAGPEVVRGIQQVNQLAGPASSLVWNLDARTELGVGWSF